MKRYQVTWGVDSIVVSAASERDAWSQFCHRFGLAVQHPKLHERKILEVTEEPQRVLLVESDDIVPMDDEVTDEFILD